MSSNNKFLSQLLVSFLEFAKKGNGVKEASVFGQFEKACYEKITDQIRSSIGKEMTLALLVKIEEYILEQKRDAATKKGDKEALNSILSGLDRVNNGYDALKVINNVEKYKTATRIISDQDFISGLPKDSFIKFCVGQKKSIENAERNDYPPSYRKRAKIKRGLIALIGQREFTNIFSLGI